MLDIALLGFVAVVLALGLRRPFFWVLAYIYIDLVSPQKIGWGLVQVLPLSLIAFAAAFAGWLLLDSKDGSRFTLRQALIVALLAYCGMTTLNAAFPVEAWTKWGWVWKALVFAAFLPLTLRTRLRMEAAVLVIVLSIGTITINGGLKTALGGGGYGMLALLVREDSGLYEGSIISTAAIAIIPLALWLARHGTIFTPDWRVKVFTGALIFACLLMPVGTSARTGLVCVVMLAAVLVRSARRRLLYVGLASAALVIAVPFLPQQFTERMATIKTPEGDEFASTRLEVWKWTLGYAQEHPFGGGFDAYLGNSFTYQTTKAVGTPPNVTYEHETVTDTGRAYHSSYFEMLGEQGYAGFALWLALMGLGVWQMERVRMRFARREGGRDSWQWGLATALQQAQLIYLVGAAFVGIAFQPFAFLFVGLQCGLWSYVKRTEAGPAKAHFRRPGALAEKPLPAAG